MVQMTSESPEVRRCMMCGRTVPAGAPERLCGPCLLKAGIEDTEPESEEILDHPPASPQPVVGTFFGDYELLGELGRGGMGIVKKARQFGTQRLVALKLLSAGALATREAIHRFHTEAQAASVLAHPNIVPIYEVGTHEGQYFLTMRFLPGGTLADWLKANPPNPRRVAELMRQVAAAVQFAHEHGVLHRDLKPGNILLDEEGNPAVCDFGLARIADGEEQLTVTSVFLGTASYMAPELIQGGSSAGTIASDVYALGAMLYELLAGVPPFKSASFADTLRQIQEIEPVRPGFASADERQIPLDLETICLKCLSKEPGERYPSAAAFSAELNHFLNGEPVHARPVTRLEHAWRWCCRKPAFAATLAIAHLLLAVVLIGSLLATYRISQARHGEQAQLARVEAKSIEARQLAYASDIRLAQQESLEGNFFHTLQLLDQQRPASSAEPDLRGWEWRYLKNVCRGQELSILGGHSNGVECAGFLPDGETLFSGGRDGTLRFWSVTQRRETGVIHPGDWVTAAACSNDGRWLATVTETPSGGATSNPVQLWDLGSRTRVMVEAAKLWTRPSLTFSPDSTLLAIFTEAEGVVLWDLNQRRELLRLPAPLHYLAPMGLAFSPDGQLLAFSAGGDGGEIVLWDVATRTERSRFKAHPSRVDHLLFSQDNQRLFSFGDGRLHVWDWRNQTLFGAITNFASPVLRMTLSRDDRLLAFAAVGQRAWLYDAQTLQLRRELLGHTRVVTTAVVTSAGDQVVTGSWDGTLRIWSVTPPPTDAVSASMPKGLVQFAGGSSPALALSPDATHLATVYEDNRFHFWNVASLQSGPLRELPVKDFSCAAVSPSGLQAAFADHSGNVVVWNPVNNEAVALGRPCEGDYERMTYSNDGQKLALASSSGQASVWDMGTRQEVSHFLIDTKDTPMSLVLSPAKDKVLMGFFNGEVRVWQLNPVKLLAQLSGHTHQVQGLALLPDGRTVVGTAWDIRFWNLTTGEPSRPTWRPAETMVFACQPSADGRRLLTGESFGPVRLWDLASGRELLRLDSDIGTVRRVGFLPDQETIVAVSEQGIRLWKAPHLIAATGLAAL